MRRGENRTTKTTLWRERSSTLKKGLTGPTLLEMFDYGAYLDDWIAVALPSVVGERAVTL